MLNIQNLTVRRGDKDVLQDVNFSLAPGDLVALIGSNGVGKSTLAMTIFGHPSCTIVSGMMSLDDIDLAPLETHERVKLGLFLAHQEPPVIAGVTVAQILRAICEATRPQPYSTAEFYAKLRQGTARLGLAYEFVDRNFNEAFSGGEKKRTELLALLLVNPKYAVLDEIDSGMDVVARAMIKVILTEMRSAGTGFLVISHNQDLIEELRPTKTISL